MPLDTPSRDINKKVDDQKRESRRYQNYSYYSFAIAIFSTIIGSQVSNLLKEYSNIISIVTGVVFLIFYIVCIYFTKKSRTTLPVIRNNIISGFFETEFFLDRYENGDTEKMSKAIDSLRNIERDISYYKFPSTGFENEKLNDSIKMLKENISFFIHSLGNHESENIRMWMNNFSTWRHYLIENKITDFYDNMLVYKEVKKKEARKSFMYISKEWLHLTGWKFILSTIIVISLIALIYFLLPSSRELMAYIGGLYALIKLIIDGGGLFNRIEITQKGQTLK